MSTNVESSSFGNGIDGVGAGEKKKFVMEFLFA
jgi:hypothetical protein